MGLPVSSDSAASDHQRERRSQTRERHVANAATKSAQSITMFFNKGLPGPSPAEALRCRNRDAYKAAFCRSSILQLDFEFALLDCFEFFGEFDLLAPKF